MYLPSEKELENYNVVDVLISTPNIQEFKVNVKGKMLKVKAQDSSLIIQTNKELACFVLDKVISCRFYHI
ncbi:MAG: hypothetical protein LUH05_03000 [Candidatus Gastranaerophilales bacterium]|nr:hypothetical protein [Candidatus Gastranaerophilales bacterium]